MGTFLVALSFTDSPPTAAHPVLSVASLVAPLHFFTLVPDSLLLACVGCPSKPMCASPRGMSLVAMAVSHCSLEQT